VKLPELLDCQSEALVRGRQHILDGRKRIIVVLPTGGGKTVVMSAIIHSARRNFNSKILIVVHSIELINQAVAELEEWGITEIGVIRANDRRYAPLMPVQVASIQTLSRRDIEWFQPSIVFVDECHRAAADTYMTNVFDAYPDAIHFGLSATPCRADGKPLGRNFGGPYDALEVAAQYSDLILAKFISEPRCFSVPEKPDLSQIHTVAGDYNLEELEEVMMGQALVGGIFKRWSELYACDGHKRATVIFATSIKHSREIEKLFQDNGVNIAHLDGTTPMEVRKSMLARLSSGELQAITNVGVLEEGWNCPPAKCGILARPTKSLRLYMQQVGRFLRPCCGCGHVPADHDHGACTKCGCLNMGLVTPFILDHAGNFDRHQAPHTDRIWSLDEAPQKSKSAGNFKVCPDCYAYIASHTRVCPHCDHSFERQMEEEERMREVNVPLVERTQAIDPRRRDFDAFFEEARKKGYKPTWASVRYKEKYGDWPPYAWAQFAKASFDNDLQWQTKHSRNEIWRERRRIERAEEERPTEDKLMEMADKAFKEWDPVDFALLSPEEQERIREPK
jgi:superfamily II DNA or RNA helicase